jgi:arginine decarboxylase
MSEGEGWRVEDSVELYRIEGWGQPYFGVDEQTGNMVVRPDPRQADRQLDLFALVQDLAARGLELPLLIRFSDVLRDRLRLINECFAKAIDEYSYGNRYQGVYPVKVNQQKHLVDEIADYGRPWAFGLEAGSKPELLIALAASSDPSGLIICNGYKDDGYIETALIAQRFDKTVIVVLERIEELEMVIAASKKLGIKPMLGVRAKLMTKGVGRWSTSTGQRAKFGLTAAEIVEVVDRLATEDLLDCLVLLHFHIGSQISSILPIKNALREASHLFVELCNMGCSMRYLDVGGGLAVDYDGSKTSAHSSRNYDVQEYAYDVVGTVQEACDKAGVAHPTIVSESGRALVAHQSVLVFEVVSTSEFPLDAELPPVEADAHEVLQRAQEALDAVEPGALQEAWHDIQQAHNEGQTLFKLGYLDLRTRARLERIYWACCGRILRAMAKLDHVPEELSDLEERLAAIYYCNFSIFQSAPDAWAIDQMFPIVPLQRLDEEPTVRATLVDLTCDSDGTIDQFIDADGPKSVIEVHPMRAGEPYYMGMFLAGAYQEILGDMHNLFGDTNAVHVELVRHGYHVAHVVKGDSVSKVLKYVQYVPDDMVERVRQQAERALRNGRISLDNLRLLMRHYESSLHQYTYLAAAGEERED